MEGFIEIKHENGTRDSIRTDTITNFWEEKQGNQIVVKLVLMNDFDNAFTYPGTYEKLKKAMKKSEFDFHEVTEYDATES